MAICRIKLLIFFWVCFCVPAILAATRIRYCDKKGNYAVKVKGVEMEPNPVVSGQQAKFLISANSDKSISAGQVILSVYFLGLPVHSEKIDICKETTCPVAAGKFVLSHIQTLPGITPAGSYSLRMRMEDSNNQVLTCISFGFNIIKPSYVSDS